MIYFDILTTKKRYGYDRYVLKSMKKKLSTLRGFTLIELLIVIAVLGVLAAGVIVALDPVERINQANDARAQQDIGVVGRSAETYATTHDGNYPFDIPTLKSSGETKVDVSLNEPSANYNYQSFVPGAPNSCVPATPANCTSFVAVSELMSKRFNSVCAVGEDAFFKYDTTNGKACAVCAADATAASAVVCP